MPQIFSFAKSEDDTLESGRLGHGPIAMDDLDNQRFVPEQRDLGEHH
jgi:hypothetical protein